MQHVNKLLIMSRKAAHYAELLEQYALPHLEYAVWKDTQQCRKFLAECDVILGEPKRVAPLLQLAPQLKWVQSTFAGVEMLVNSPPRTDYLLAGVKNVFGPLISEYVFAYLLALERHLFEQYNQQQARRWHSIPYTTLQSKLIGVCGLGSIGQHLAQTATHFGMRVWGYKRTPETVPGVERVFTSAEWREFLAQPEYIVITLPHTPETEHLFDMQAFQGMNPSAMLINVGRGKVVSESDLVQAIQQRQIRGAVLDVFAEEPLPENSPLWTMSNVFITPHNSAYSFPEDIVKIFVENYHRYTAGKPLRYLINFEKGY